MLNIQNKRELVLPAMKYRINFRRARFSIFPDQFFFSITVIIIIDFIWPMPIAYIEILCHVPCGFEIQYITKS
jgi:hypothetical protein